MSHISTPKTQIRPSNHSENRPRNCDPQPSPKSFTRGLWRRGSVYQFHMRVPRDLRDTVQQDHVNRSLGADGPSLAARLCRKIGVEIVRCCGCWAARANRPDSRIRGSLPRKREEPAIFLASIRLRGATWFADGGVRRHEWPLRESSVRRCLYGQAAAPGGDMLTGAALCRSFCSRINRSRRGRA
ncbi:DUF6538 domain-containing protein [Novosphingobium humi]|uniref:DUF6538 domain-containing protein n=1 Tax=Novosphingobium humi TaxID=2282397 RepID=UPI00338E7F4D